MDLTARITIDAKKHYPVEEKVFGHFIEHLGTCIRDGVWDERESGGPREFGQVRRDVFEAMRALRPPILRWPGGCFSDTYHWRDGVGPAARRPARVNRSWWWLQPPHTFFENNHFGTDEFVELCRRLGAAPYIAANFGSGSPREAADWVEYCNSPPGTRGGDLRAENGHPEPYGVKYWGIANEIWGVHEAGFCVSGALYARRYLPFLHAMREADPGIKVVAVGANRLFPSWNRLFLKRSGAASDFLSLHEYTPGVNPLNTASVLGMPRTEKAYYNLIAGAEMFRDSILWFQDTLVEALGPEPKVKIAFDEWNAWWMNRQLLHAEDYTQREAILTACTLSHLVKLSPILGMANFAQMVNCLGLIMTTPDGVVLTPSYHAFKLYRDFTHDHVLETEVACDTARAARTFMDLARKPMPLVEVLATRKRRGGISALIVNKHYSEPVSAEISFKGFSLARRVETRTLHSESPFDSNTIEEPKKVGVSEGKEKSAKGVCRLTVPPHAVVQAAFVPGEWKRRE